MIAARLVRAPEEWAFECAGHAENAPPGRDIVCAGVSAICMALDARLAALAAQRKTTGFRREIGEGFFSLAVSGDPAVYAGAFETALAGLRTVAGLYPARLAVTEEALPERQKEEEP